MKIYKKTGDKGKLRSLVEEIAEMVSEWGLTERWTNSILTLVLVRDVAGNETVKTVFERNSR
ncbi:MAG: hypothetical protein U5M50_13250 [Sphingobium sp.]|nr:hypothetical protein [Sphingobium sp.]